MNGNFKMFGWVSLVQIGYAQIWISLVVFGFQRLKGHMDLVLITLFRFRRHWGTLAPEKLRVNFLFNNYATTPSHYIIKPLDF